ncbi:hypothetical protein P2318_20260 [Myxococcaceae bacterium GXIMD 01537]
MCANREAVDVVAGDAARVVFLTESGAVDVGAYSAWLTVQRI